MRRIVFNLPDRAVLWRCALLAFTWILATHTTLGASPILLGPVEELAVLDDFTPANKQAWKANAGQNVSYQLEFGRNIPGIADSLLEIGLSKNSQQDSTPGHNWFSIKRDLPTGSIGEDAEGIRLVIGSQPAAQWWINVNLRVGTNSYAHVLEPTYPSRTLIEHVIPFDEFTCAGRKLSAAEARSISGIGLDLSTPIATLFIDRITTYRQQKYQSWLSWETARPEHNIFQPGERVQVTFSPGGLLPDQAKGFRYEVQGFFTNVVGAGFVPLNGSTNFALDLTPKQPGFYEFRAYWVDRENHDLENRSCLLSEGSMPPGLATFSLLSRTVSQNIERFKKLKAGAFFGLHGDFHGLADLMGLTWRFDYSRWTWLEPQKPDRSGGLASWAAQRIKQEAPQPDYRPHILPFSGNFAGPDWTKHNASKSPPFFDWDDYLPMVHDYVEVEKQLHPGMHPRVYGVAWEVNLNMPPDNLGPPYTPADVVELHRRAREVIKATDPDSIVIGPCPSNLNSQWMESVFKAGLLKYLDAIESHGYADAGFMPEDNDYPGKLSALNQLMRQYNGGRVLPIYITEAGIRGLLGSKYIYRDQARFITRLAIILKGEGVKVFLPFYGIDYDRDGWWGFCFNLEIDAANPWMTWRISPKPSVNALATCAQVLEGCQPIRRVTGLGDKVWAYLFQREDGSVLAIWSCGEEVQISLPVEKFRSLNVVDIMGNVKEFPVNSGKLSLQVNGSPQYVLGISDKGLP